MISKSITKEQVLETMYEDGATYHRWRQVVCLL